jgi:hypothetical protein
MVDEGGGEVARSVSREGRRRKMTKEGVNRRSAERMSTKEEARSQRAEPKIASLLYE